MGSPPNLIGRELIEQATGRNITFFDWMATPAPLCLAMFVVLAVVLVACPGSCCHPSQRRPQPEPARVAGRAPDRATLAGRYLPSRRVAREPVVAVHGVGHVPEVEE